MYKNLCKMIEELKLPRVQETFSCKTTFFKMGPRARQLWKPGNKQNKIEQN